MFNGKFLVFLGIAVSITPAPAADLGGNINARNAVVLAEVNGAPLTLADFERKRPVALFPARSNFYDAQRKLVEEFIDEYILEQRAKKDGLTVEQLLEKQAYSKIAKDPSEETLRVYYEGVDTTESFDAVKDRIVEAIRQRRMAKAKLAYMKSLRTETKVVMRMEPPRAPISLKDTTIRGAANAPVMLVEYADYECPYCVQVQPSINKLEAEYKGKLAFVYKDFPLPMHANAQKAAEASHCAAEQNKYWDYHDLLLTKGQLSIPALKANAGELKLDTETFAKCLDSGKTAEIVRGNLAEAQSLGLSGTPSFFVNGRPVSGTVTYEKLREMIDAELSAAQPQRATGSADRPTVSQTR